MGRKAKPRQESISLHVTERAPMGCALLKDLLSKPAYQIEVVSSAVDLAQTLDAVKDRPPDVALISAALRENERGGFETLRRLRATSPKTRAILLLDDPERSLIVEAFRSGSHGVYFRTDSLEMLPRAIRCVHQGQVWAGSRDLQFLLEEFTQYAPPALADVRRSVRLTERELHVMGLVAEGYTNRKISEVLGLSAHTVKNYVFRVFDKTGVSSRLELALYAQSLLHPPGSGSDHQRKAG